MYLAYGGIQFLAYRSATQAIEEVSPYKLPGTAVSFFAGAAAGTAATTVTYPLDLLRTRFAAQGNDRVYTSLLSSIRDIASNEGPKGFFRGLGAGIGQIVPYMGLFFRLLRVVETCIRWCVTASRLSRLRRRHSGCACQYDVQDGRLPTRHR